MSHVGNQERAVETRSTQPIASYETRMGEYRAKRRVFVAFDVVGIAVVVALATWLWPIISQYSFGQQVFPTWMVFAIAAVGSAVPFSILLRAQLGPRPEPGDVLADQAFRRAVGLADEVEKA